MTESAFSAWLGTDRSGPVPDFEPLPVGAADGLYWLSTGPEDDSTIVQAWCAEHTTSGRDYLGEWVVDTENPDKHNPAIRAVMQQHDHDHHGGPDPKVGHDD